ncbi:MAG: glycoside hydrolase family 16 protein [Actinomycetia bacterium]|nr:glycoside hydrolase family 16 protein [Actinomycetes bacterium]
MPSLIERAREAKMSTARVPRSIRRMARPAAAVVFTALAVGVIGGTGDRAKVLSLSTEYLASPASSATPPDGDQLGVFVPSDGLVDGLNRIESVAPTLTTQVTRAVADSTSSTTALSTTVAPTTPTTRQPTTPTTRQPTTTTTRRPTTTAAPTTTASPSTTLATTTSTTSEPPSTSAPSTTEPQTNDGPVIAACRPWTLAIDEHFDGGTLESDRWESLTADGDDGVGIRRPSTLVVGEGVLSIRASMVGGQPWGGALRLRNDEPYGRYEIRVRTDASSATEVVASIGIWPSDGDLPTDGGYELYRSTSADADDDGTDDVRPFSSIFHPTLSDGATTVIEHSGDASEWETLVLEWTPESSTLLRNDVVIRSLDPNEHPIPDGASALGISFDTTASTLGEAAVLEIDFVRVHRWRGCD